MAPNVRHIQIVYRRARCLMSKGKPIGGSGIIVEADETWLPNILPAELHTRAGTIVFKIDI